MKIVTDKLIFYDDFLFYLQSNWMKYSTEYCNISVNLALFMVNTTSRAGREVSNIIGYISSSGQTTCLSPFSGSEFDSQKRGLEPSPHVK